MKAKWLLIISILIIAFIAIATVMITRQHHSTKVNDQRFIKSHTATIFLHGYGGSEKSETFMVKQATQQGVTQNVITAKVDSNGEVNFKGHMKSKAINPIIKIELEDNKNGDTSQNAKNIKNVLSQLKTKYEIKKYNFVGHSMGNLSFAYFMKMYGIDKKLPQLNKEVNIAGTFNGVLNLNEKVNEISVDKKGKPNKMTDNFKELLPLKNIYKNKDIKVLNIYGDLKDGTHSDGRVSNSSSKSLQYLIGNSVKSYKESKYTGKSAQHSQLHENKKVADEIVEFLWAK
ncbi:alpha/beta hydrolase [Staphylococcus sp. E463]|uniref:alpha/beta hydrolase n=1 Tax=Staphylococcus sp. E463 TaxID=1234593 RepID=UPI0002E8BB5C|nr:alpha/beta hydrolase [Staphylococcus sp. E463]